MKGWAGRSGGETTGPTPQGGRAPGSALTYTRRWDKGGSPLAGRNRAGPVQLLEKGLEELRARGRAKDVGRSRARHGQKEDRGRIQTGPQREAEGHTEATRNPRNKGFSRNGRN